MKWFKRRKREPDDFDLKYGDLADKIISESKADKLSLEQENLIANNESQRRQFVENNCEKIVEASKRIEETKKEFQLVNNYLSDIQMIESLPDSNHDKVTGYAKKMVVLEKDRQEFGNSMTKISNSQFNQIKDCGDDISNILKGLQDDENYCQKVKSDMNHLEGEKSALRFERRTMKDRIYMVRGVSKIAVAAVVVLLGALMAVQFGAHKDMTAFTYVLVGVAAIATLVLFYIHNQAVRNIKITELKMNRAIALLNKVKLKYVNVQSRIEYMYEKFGIHSAYELNKMWAVYLKVCKEREVYHKASDKLLEAEEDLVEELKKYSINDPEIWISQASALVDDKEMKQIKNNLIERRNRLKSTIDYNADVLEKSTSSIKELVEKNKEHAKEIMDIVDRYQE